jgi:hypothetical protein
MISTAKSILYNEIGNEIPDYLPQLEAPRFRPPRAELDTTLPLLPLSVLSAATAFP